MAYIGPSPTLPGSVNTTDIEDSAVTAIKLGANNQPGSSGQLLSTDGSGGLSWAADAGMVYPGAGIPLSTGSAWGTSFTAPSSALVGLTDTQTLTNKTLTAPIINSLSSLSVVNNVVVGGDLTVNGTTTTIDSQTLSVKDKNIEMGVVSSPSDATADGGGLTLKGATDKTFNWIDSTDAWTSSEHIKLASGKTFIGDGSTLTALNASNITSGTIAAARVPTLNQNTTGSAATLTTARTIAGVSFDGSANISLNNNAITNGAGYITSSGTSAGFSAGNASNLNSGTVPIARLGSSGSASSSTFLRGDNSWQTITSGGTTWSSSDYNLYTPTAGNSNAGDYNISLGKDAGYALSSNNEHTINIGNEAGYVAHTNSGQIYFGYQAGKFLTGGNICIGYKSGLGVSGSSTASSVTAIGKYALRDITTGGPCVAVGSYAGWKLTSGINNVIIGDQAGYYVTSGASNTFLGQAAGHSTTTGNDNICIGKYAYGPTTGANNILIGTGSALSSNTGSNEITLGNTSITKFRIPGINFVLKDNGGTPSAGQVLTADSNGEGYWAAGGLSSDAQENTIAGTNAGNSFSGTSAINNTLFGYDAGTAITSGDFNTVVGSDALMTGTTVQKTVAIGYQAGKVFTDGWSVFIGHDAGKNNTTGTGIAIGSSALGANSAAVTGSANIAIGSETLYAVTSGGYNVVFGHNAGKQLTQGNQNTIIGDSCNTTALSQATTTGSNNTVIGYTAHPSAATVSNEITLGNTYITKFRIPGINFILKDNGGTPSSGQVLTADGSGEGYWATPAASGGTTWNSTNYNLYTATAGTQGTYNLVLGYQAGYSLASQGGYNTIFGYQAGYGLSTGDYNIAIGSEAGKSFSTGHRNIAIGPWCISSNTLTGTDNVAMGNSTLKHVTSGTYNTAIGPSAGHYHTTGSDNTYIGRNAGYSNTTGTYNVMVGAYAGNSHTTGVSNSFFGYSAGYAVTTGNYNTCIGINAGNSGSNNLTVGNNNIIIGYQAAASSSSASEEITLGYTGITKFRIPGINFVLKDNGGTPSSGQVLTADGNGEGYWAAAGGLSSDAQYNTVGGTSAGSSFSGSSATNNTLIGYNSGTAITSGDKNTALGSGSLLSSQTGEENTSIGYYNSYQITTGTYNNSLGAWASYSLTTGTQNVAIGGYCLYTQTTSSNNTAIGYAAGYQLSTGAENTLLGHNVAYKLSTGTENVAIGVKALYGDGGSVSGQANIAIGKEAGYKTQNGGYNINIGRRAAYLLSSGTNNTVIGSSAGYNLSSGTYNIAIGDQALYGSSSVSGSNNVAIGNQAGYDIQNADNNTLIGYAAGSNITTANYNTCIGTSAGDNLTTGHSNIVIGRDADASSATAANEITLGDTSITKFRIPGINFTLKDHGSTPAVGRVLTADSNGEGNWEYSNARTSDNTIGGWEAGKNMGSTAYFNTLFGYRAGQSINSGDDNMCIGHYAGQSITYGEDNITIGNWVGYSLTYGKYNTIIGNYAGYNSTTNESNTFVGYYSGFSSTTGNNNVAIGKLAIYSVTTGANNTCIGHQAGQSGANNLTTGSNNILIGNDAAASSGTVSNEITFGNSSITKFRIPGINFVLKDNGGTPSSGQVLTADGSGEGYWASASSGVSSDSYRNTIGGTNAGDSFSSSNALDNTLFGYDSGTDITTADYNTCFGSYAGANLTTGGANTFIGYYAGGNSTTGTDNVAVGNAALYAANTTGGYNVAIGTYPLMYVTSGQRNVGIGYNAGYDLTTGAYNILIGDQAGEELTTGSDNIGIGQDCLGANASSSLTGDNNVAIGKGALGYIHTGSMWNTAIGIDAGRDLTTGSINVFLGKGASQGSTTCNYAVSIGEGSNVQNGTGNIAIGWNASSASSTTNECTIGSTSLTKFRIPGINFILKDNGGTPSAGQVLTADSNGEGYWATGGGTTINNNANNRVITGSGTANTLEGESNLTFDGTNLSVPWILPGYAIKSQGTLDIYGGSSGQYAAMRFVTNGEVDIKYQGLARIQVINQGTRFYNTVIMKQGINEGATTITSSSNAATLDQHTATNFEHTLTENVTYTFSNAAQSGDTSSFTLKVIQDSSARTITWPNSVDWAGGTAPTLSTGSGDVDVFVFITYNGGSTYYGFTAGQDLT